MNDRIVELVNREIDGLLSAEDRAELQQILASDSEARQFHENHTYAAGLLSKLPTAEPPSNLKHRIMSSVRSFASQNAAAKATTKKRSGFSLASLFQPSSAFPLALGMAAGILLMVIFWNKGTFSPAESNGMAGTLVDWSAKDADGGHEPISLIAGPSEAVVHWVHSNRHVVLFIDVKSIGGSTLDLHSLSSSLPILSVARKSPGTGNIQTAPNQFLVSHSGTNSYAVVLDPNTESSLTLEVSLTSNGETVSQPVTINWR